MVSPLFEWLPSEWPRWLVIAGIALLVADAWRRIALRRGVLDVPGHRSSHVVATPRGAGVGIAVALGLAIALWAPRGEGGAAVLLGGLVVALVGFVDDLRPLRASTKFAGQALAALPVAIALPLTPEGLPFAIPAALSVVAGMAVVLLFVNAWNFMDGIDGIATLAAMAVCAAVLGASAGAGAGLVVCVALSVLAACAGFLPLNFPKARAFMGDCGSHVLGFALASLVLAAPRVEIALVAMVASSAFLVDVLGTLVLRALDGEPLASAHRRHLYQLVTRSGYSHGRVTMVYGAWMLVSGGGMAVADSAGWSTIVATGFVGATTLAWWLLTRHFTRRLKERGTW